MTLSMRQRTALLTCWTTRPCVTGSTFLSRLSALVLLVMMSACVLPSFVPASVAQNTTAIDSLLWYTEQLEADLKLLKIQSKQDKNALLIQLEFMGTRLEWAEEDRLHWYEKPALWFMIGAAIGLLVAGWALNITY